MMMNKKENNYKVVETMIKLHDGVIVIQVMR